MAVQVLYTSLKCIRRSGVADDGYIYNIYLFFYIRIYPIYPIYIASRVSRWWQLQPSRLTYTISCHSPICTLTDSKGLGF
jgi:hypothetical protein